ncbi:MAG: polyprenyl diphosphate synthase [Dehalococcoidia bacterium]|nr:polyprenyl diphosphate synthase [Dehalococcoidia bacterium]
MAMQETETESQKLPIVPVHVAIIMDGNGRWAEQRGLPRLAGHKAGTENVRRIVEAFMVNKVKYLTLYAFSTENWNRPTEEVTGLMAILREVIESESLSLHENGVRIRHIGRFDGVSPELREAVLSAVALTEHNDRLNLNVAFNYGGRAEILDAVSRMVAAGVDLTRIDEDTFSEFLYTAGLPDPDLIIRTAGEMRLSNFLIWQAAYSEYYSSSVFWPDFGEEEVEKALIAYSQRKRRFGGLEPR